MTTQLYTVTLTNLGTYTVTVAAGTEAEATSIAKTVLHEEALTLPPDMERLKRETDAVAVPATAIPVRQYRISGTYSIDFHLTVPARDPDEAERHAKRLYAENCGPYEFEVGDERVDWARYREVVS